MELTLTPGQLLRITPRDEVSLNLGETASQVDVTFTQALSGDSVVATTDSFGVVAMPSIQPPELVEVKWDELGVTMNAHVEVVQAHYCDLASIATHGTDGDTPESRGATDEELWNARATATTIIERNAHRSFVKVVRQQHINTLGGIVALEWPDVEEVDIEGDLIGDGALLLDAGTYDVTYVSGLFRLPDAIKQACVMLAASMLTPSRIPDRATGESTDAGMIHFTLAGQDGATGIPDVDAAIEQFGRKRSTVL